MACQECNDMYGNLNRNIPVSSRLGEAHFSILAAELQRNPAVQNVATQFCPDSFNGSREELKDLWDIMVTDHLMRCSDLSDVFRRVLIDGGDHHPACRAYPGNGP